MRITSGGRDFQWYIHYIYVLYYLYPVFPTPACIQVQMQKNSTHDFLPLLCIYYYSNFTVTVLYKKIYAQCAEAIACYGS